MTEREDIIKRIENSLNWMPTNSMTVTILRSTAKRALSVLKEQEAVKPVLDEQTGRIWLCGKCGTYVGFEDNDPHDPNEYDKYCRECGRPVLWEGR